MNYRHLGNIRRHSLLRAALPVLLLLGWAVQQDALAYVNVRVNSSPSNPEETSIAINPTDPQNVIGVAQAAHCFFYPTFDGGATWTEGYLTDPYCLGDPSVVFDADGNAFYCYIGTFSHSGIFVARSTNGGTTWRPGTPVIEHTSGRPFEDKSYPVCDWTHGPYRGNVYVSWSQFDVYGSSNPADSSRILFSRSTNGGLTFSVPLRISDRGGDAVDSDNTVEGAIPAVGPDGAIYVAWAGPRGLEFDRSVDGGLTFGADRVISDIPGGWDFGVPGLYRCNGLPTTKADISNGPHHGRVYVCWSDQRNDDTDVFLLYSDDGGVTWGPRIRVNNDLVGNGREQFFPWIDVDPVQGTVYVVFYDRREHSDNFTTDVYLAVSTDGGATFGNERISVTPFTPNPSNFFGDYIGVSAYDGRVRPLWMRQDGGSTTIWTALIDFVPGETPESLSELARLAVYPNPARSFVRLSSPVALQDRLHLEIFDVQGRLIRQLVGETPEGGRAFALWNTRANSGSEVASGIYLVKGTGLKPARVVVLR